MLPMRKFTFDVSFDPDEPAPEPEAVPEPEPPPEPTYSQGEFDAALAAARAEGMAEGEAKARAEVERTIDAAIAGAAGRVADDLARLVDDRRAADAKLEQDAVRVARAALSKVLPATSRRHALEEIMEIVAGCVAELKEEPRIVVRVADPLLDPLREALNRDASARGFAGHLVLLADESLAPGDVRVEWADGGAERDGAALARAVDAALARAAADDAEPADSAVGPDATTETGTGNGPSPAHTAAAETAAMGHA